MFKKKIKNKPDSTLTLDIQAPSFSSNLKVKNERFRVKYTMDKMKRLLDANLSWWDPELCAIEIRVWSKLLEGPFSCVDDSDARVFDAKRRFSEILIGFSNTDPITKN